jgi:hypothetical protein
MGYGWLLATPLSDCYLWRAGEFEKDFVSFLSYPGGMGWNSVTFDISSQSPRKAA